MNNTVLYKKERFKTLGGEGWSDDHIKNGLPFTRWEIQAFELWYEFMRRTERFCWSDEVQLNFTAINRRQKDGSFADITFNQWWEQNSLCFYKGRLLALEEIDANNREGLEFLAEEAKESGDTPVILLALFPDASVIDLKRKFAEILAKYPGSRNSKFYNYDPGYKNNEGEGAGWEKHGYGLYSEKHDRYRPNLNMLRDILDIYDEWMAARKRKEKFTLDQIEQWVSDRRVKERKKTIISRHTRAESKKAESKEAESKKVEYDWNGIEFPLPPNKRKIQAATVSRALKQARYLLDNVANGVFPKMTPPGYVKDVDRTKLHKRNGKKSKR